jgi:hypothetical protein
MAGNGLPHPNLLVASGCSTANFVKWLRTSPTFSNCFSAREELISTELANEDKSKVKSYLSTKIKMIERQMYCSMKSNITLFHTIKEETFRKRKRINEETNAYMYFISL